MISFCSLFPQYHVTQTLCVWLMMLGWDAAVGGGGGVLITSLWTFIYDDLFLLIASTVPRHTDALRVNNVPLVEFLSLAQGSAKRKRSSFGRRYFHSKTLSLPRLCAIMRAFIHSFIHSVQFSSVQFSSSVQFISFQFVHSFIHSFIQPSKRRAQPRSACTTE